MQTNADHFDRWRDFYSATNMPLDVVANDSCHDCRGTCSDDHSPYNGGLRVGSLGSLETIEVKAGAADIHRTHSGIRRSDPGGVKIAMQVRGRTLLVQDDRKAVLRPGDFVLYESSRPYVLRFDSHFTLFYLTVPPNRLKLSSLATLTAVPIRAEGGVGSLVSPLLSQLRQDMSTGALSATPIFEDAVLDLVCAALSGYGPSATPGAAVVASAKTFIDAHLADPRLDTSMVAGALHISVRYLQKLFNEEHLTVAGWIRQRRLERCRRDLQDPMRARQSIGDICARHGLVDSAHFSQMFKRAYGLSPRAFREQIRFGPAA